MLFLALVLALTLTQILNTAIGTDADEDADAAAAVFHTAVSAAANKASPAGSGSQVDLMPWSGLHLLGALCCGK